MPQVGTSSEPTLRLATCAAIRGQTLGRSRDRSELEKRVCFDFEIDFSNGGGLQGQGFRLDIEGDDISDKDLADYIVRDMRLLMVGECSHLK